LARRLEPGQSAGSAVVARIRKPVTPSVSTLP
jgi:hypothetical protein